MAQKVRLGGELDPRTVEGIAADAKTIIDRKNGNKRQDDMNTELAEAIATKQAALVSGTNIKTINNQSLLGEGNIEIQGGGVQSDWNETDTTDPAYIKHKPIIPDVSGKADKSEMSVTPGTGANADKITIQLKQGTSATVLAQHQDISGKQDTINDLSAIRSGAAAGATAQQPATTLVGYGITDGATKTELQSLESEVDSKLEEQDAAITLLDGHDVVITDDHTTVVSPDTQKIYREPYHTEQIDGQGTAVSLIGNDYYSYLPIVLENDTTYVGLNNCVFINLQDSTIIGNTLTTTSPSGDEQYAVAKQVDGVSDVADLSYTKTNDDVTPTKYTDWMCTDNTTTPVTWKKIATYTFPGIDKEPTAGSDNLVKSGGVYEEVNTLGQKVTELTNNIDIKPANPSVEEEIAIHTNDGEEIARFDKNGFTATKISIQDDGERHDVIPPSVVGYRIVESTEVEVLDDNENFLAKIATGGIRAKDFIIQRSFADPGESVTDLISRSAAVSINLPDMITAVVGDTLQIFLRGVIMAFNPYIYDIKFTCQKGKQTPRYFQVSPTSEDVGEYPLRIDVRSYDGSVTKTKSTTLKIVDKINLVSSTKNVLCFGDSLTSGGDWCAEADRRLTGSGGTPSGLALSNVNFVGKMTNGTTGYFGQGGWSWSDFVTMGRSAFRFQVSGVNNIVYGAVYSNNGHTYTVVENNTTGGVGNILCAVSSLSDIPTASGVLTKVSGGGDATINFSSASADSLNPLWDYAENKMTFIPYANEYCGGQIDIVYTLLTWNGQYAWRSNFDNIIVNGAKKFADTLHAEYPNAKLKILGIQVPSQNGGCGANYGATGEYGDAYGLAVTSLRLNDAYQAFANDVNYSSFVEFVNVSSQFDTEYNMPYSDTDVNTRNSNKKEIIGTNGVHPSMDGYMQIADVVYRNMIKTLNN